MKDLMKKYTRAFSVSGREASLAAQIAEDLRPFADSVSTDAMGNLIVLKKGKDGGKKRLHPRVQHRRHQRGRVGLSQGRV